MHCTPFCQLLVQMRVCVFYLYLPRLFKQKITNDRTQTSPLVTNYSIFLNHGRINIVHYFLCKISENNTLYCMVILSTSRKVSLWLYLYIYLLLQNSKILRSIYYHIFINFYGFICFSSHWTTKSFNSFTASKYWGSDRN